METVFISCSKSDLQDLIAETVIACLQRSQYETAKKAANAAQVNDNNGKHMSNNNVNNEVITHA